MSKETLKLQTIKSLEERKVEVYILHDETILPDKTAATFATLTQLTNINAT